MELMERLSPREKQVLNCAVKGMTDDAISNELRIARTTVLTYWSRIRAKLGFSSRVELAIAATRVELDRRIQELEELLDEERRRVRELKRQISPE